MKKQKKINKREDGLYEKFKKTDYYIIERVIHYLFQISQVLEKKKKISEL
jgi:hypothetical protein